MKDVHGGRPFRSGRRGPRALATTCLAAAMAGGPTLPGSLALGAGAVGTPALVVALAPGLRQVSSEVPSGLTATAGTGQVTLRWTASAPDNSFTVYNGTSPDLGKADQVGTVTGTGAVVTGLTGGTTYYFWVVSAADSLASNMATATPLATPGAPTGLTATAGDAQVGLTWTAPVSDGSSPVTGYHVYRATSPSFRYKTLVSNPKGTSVTVIGLTNGTTYYFMVAAVNAAGDESQFSGQASARPEQLAGAMVASLTRPVAPRQLIAMLAAIGITATAGAVALAIWGRRQNSRGPQRTGLHRRTR